MKADKSLVTLSVNRGLWGEINSNLCRVDYVLSEHKIELFCFFENMVSDKDVQAMRVVGTSVAADFPGYGVEEHCLVYAHARQTLDRSEANLVFLRK